MLEIRTLVTSTAIGVCLALPALAQVSLGGMISGNDFERIFEITGAYGPVERRSNDDGPWIRGELDGTIYTVTFLNCNEANANCTSVQFRAWWDSDGAYTVDHMNQWNRDRRFSAAYLDSQGNPTIEFDVNLAGSVTAVNFDDTVQWWQAVLDQFKDMVIEPVASGGEPATAATPSPPALPSK